MDLLTLTPTVTASKFRRFSPLAASAHAALVASWAVVCNELSEQLAPAVTVLKNTYGVNRPSLCTGRNADREAATVRKQLSSWQDVPAVGETLTAYVQCVHPHAGPLSMASGSPPRENSDHQHWTTVLQKLKDGLPIAAQQAIRVWKSMFNEEVNVLDWLASKKIMDSNDKAKAWAESQALFEVLGPWGARSEVAMLGAYVRRLARECGGKPALPPAPAAALPGSAAPKIASQPQAVIDAEKEALFFNTSGGLQSARGPLPPEIDPLGWVAPSSAVGRVNIQGGTIDGTRSAGFHAGTAWYIGDNLVVTAAHVANEIFDPYGDFPYAFQPNQSATTSTVDFGVLPGGPIAHIVRLLAKGQASVIGQAMCPDDVAVMEIGWDVAAPASVPVLSLASELRVVASSKVAVLGYPAPGSGTVQMMRAMSGVFGTKRLQPGVVASLERELIWHMCSTLDGNSGSPVFSMQDPSKVIGLHVGADYLNGLLYNVAAPLVNVQRYIKNAKEVLARLAPAVAKPTSNA